MNTRTMNEMKKEIKGYLAALKRHNVVGRQVAFAFGRFADSLERYAREELGASEEKVLGAFCDLLMVRHGEVVADVAQELDWESFAMDMRAFADPEYDPEDDNDCRRSSLDEGDATVDSVLSAEEKEKLYKMCFKVADKNLWKYGASKWDVQDIAGGMYVRILSKHAIEFKHGLPKCDAEWYGFLRKDVEFAGMNHFKSSWRHPTSSLDVIVEFDGREDDECEITRVEAMNFDKEATYQPARKEDFLNTPEARVELPLIPAVCAKIAARSGSRAQAMLKDLILNESTVDDVSRKYGIKANAIYAAKKRFMDALRDNGEDGLTQVESCAA